MRKMESLRPGVFAIERATDDDIRWIAEIEGRHYSDDAIAESVLKNWKACNQNGFFVLKFDGIRIGHIDLLAIKDRVFELFCDGKIREADIPQTELYKADEKEEIRNIYVESIIIDPPVEYEGYGKDGSALKFVLSQFLWMVCEIAVPENLSYVYAIAASGAGQKLLKLLGFRIVRGGNEREDHHDLYKVGFADLAGRICRIAGNRIRCSDRRRIDGIIQKAQQRGFELI